VLNIQHTIASFDWILVWKIDQSKSSFHLPFG